MRTVVGFPQYGGLITGVTTTVTADASFPVTNVASLLSPRQVAKWDSSGDVNLTLTLSASVPLQLISIIHHTGQAGSSVAFQLKSSGGTVVGAGTVVVPTPQVPGQPQTLPMLLASPISAQTVVLTPQGNGSTPWEIGCVDLAGAYVWGDVDTSMTRGVTSRSQRQAYAGGIDMTMQQWAPRAHGGRRPLLDRTEQESTAFDFLRTFQLSKPFVYVRDIDDATVWSREAFLAKMSSIQPIVSASDPGGPFTFAIEEHLG